MGAPQQPGAKKLSDDDAKRLLKAIEERGQWQSILVEQWVEVLVRTIRELDTNPDVAKWPWISEFWIKLNGVLEELVPRFQLVHEMVESAEDVPAKDSALWRAEVVHQAVEGIRRCLTEDEVILVHYSRQVNAHVYQDAYYLQGKLDRPNLTERYRVPAVGKEFPREELRERVGGILGKYTDDFRAPAVTIARKVAGPSIDLLSALRELRKPDEQGAQPTNSTSDRAQAVGHSATASTRDE